MDITKYTFSLALLFTSIVAGFSRSSSTDTTGVGLPYFVPAIPEGFDDRQKAISTMNGYEATKAIRAFGNGKAGIPIIAMTANVWKEEVDLCFQAGMNDFIGKPFDTDELLIKIDQLTRK